MCVQFAFASRFNSTPDSQRSKRTIPWQRNRTHSPAIEQTPFAPQHSANVPHIQKPSVPKNCPVPFIFFPEFYAYSPGLAREAVAWLNFLRAFPLCLILLSSDFSFVVFFFQKSRDPSGPAKVYSPTMSSIPASKKNCRMSCRSLAYEALASRWNCKETSNFEQKTG